MILCGHSLMWLALVGLVGLLGIFVVVGGIWWAYHDIDVDE